MVFEDLLTKKGLRVKKKDILQSMEIKKPMDIDYDEETVDDIVKKIEYAIEQHESFLKVMSLDQLKELEKNNIKRRF